MLTLLGAHIGQTEDHTRHWTTGMSPHNHHGLSSPGGTQPESLNSKLDQSEMSHHNGSPQRVTKNESPQWVTRMILHNHTKIVKTPHMVPCMHVCLVHRRKKWEHWSRLLVAVSHFAGHGFTRMSHHNESLQWFATKSHQQWVTTMSHHDDWIAFRQCQTIMHAVWHIQYIQGIHVYDLP